MAYKVIILYQLYMPSYFLGTFTEYPYLWLSMKDFSGEATLKGAFRPFERRIYLLLITVVRRSAANNHEKTCKSLRILLGYPS